MSTRSVPADVPLGMMDAAYFCSRKEILDFFNNLLSMNLAKIEDTASGAVACQLMDYMFPGSIPMKKVNWEAKSEFQYIDNYKLLQAAFTKSNVQKDVNVDRLIRAKYQDNLEFCQWLKAFFEHAAPASREDYDSVARRQLGKGGKSLNSIFLPKGMKGGNVTGTRQRPLSGRVSSSASVRSNESTSNTSGSRRTSSVRQSIMPRQNSTTSSDAEVMKKNAELKRKNAELELCLTNAESERDFYFDKLRGIEVMLQVHEEKGEESEPEALLQRILKVLYAKQDDNIVVTDEGDLLENLNDLNDDNDSVLTMEDLVG